MFLHQSLCSWLQRLLFQISYNSQQIFIKFGSPESWIFCKCKKMYLDKSSCSCSGLWTSNSKFTDITFILVFSIVSLETSAKLVRNFLYNSFNLTSNIHKIRYLSLVSRLPLDNLESFLTGWSWSNFSLRSFGNWNFEEKKNHKYATNIYILCKIQQGLKYYRKSIVAIWRSCRTVQ